MKTAAVIAALASYFGPGTQVQSCHRATVHSAICAYSTPGRNVGIEATDGGGEWTWQSYARVIWRHGRFRVSAPEIE